MRSNSSQVVVLPNGVQALWIPAKSKLIHLCVVLRAGVLYETPEQLGISHFLEHMLFKKTTKRSLYHILSAVERVGGDLNAYTTREKLCIHATVPKTHLLQTIDLLADIIQNSTFPQHEIEREKAVIHEEIDLYQDSPDEQVFEDFDALVFPNHPYGNPILGTHDTIKQFDQHLLLDFSQKVIVGENICVGIWGQITQQNFEKLIHEYFSAIKPGNKIQELLPNKPQNTHNKQLKPSTKYQQAYCILGKESYDLSNPKYQGFAALNNYLCGSFMYAKIPYEIREKKALCYSIQGFYTPYLFSGIWGIMFSCDPQKYEKIITLIQKLLREVREQGLSIWKCNEMKKQFFGSMLLGMDSGLHYLTTSCKELLDTGKPILFNEIIQEINKIQPAEFKTIAEEMFDDNYFMQINLPE
ncbi:MAG: insulinase family protein [Bacteroidia bacterium]|nr:insulinase family protein [Bacteroidia bacterium]